MRSLRDVAASLPEVPAAPAELDDEIELGVADVRGSLSRAAKSLQSWQLSLEGESAVHHGRGSVCTMRRR